MASDEDKAKAAAAALQQQTTPAIATSSSAVQQARDDDPLASSVDTSGTKEFAVVSSGPPPASREEVASLANVIELLVGKVTAISESRDRARSLPPGPRRGEAPLKSEKPKSLEEQKKLDQGNPNVYHGIWPWPDGELSRWIHDPDTESWTKDDTFYGAAKATPAESAAASPILMRDAGQDPWAGKRLQSTTQTRGSSEGHEWEDYLDEDGIPIAGGSHDARPKPFINKDPPPSWNGDKNKWKEFRRQYQHWLKVTSIPKDRMDS